MTCKRNTDAIVRLAAQKSAKARQRVLDAITSLRQMGEPIKVTTVCRTANVKKPFLYDAKHADLLAMIRELGEQTLPLTVVAEKPKTKSVAAKNAQIVRLKERLETSDRKVAQLQQDNEKLFGKLSIQDSKSAALNTEVERVRQARQECKQRIERLEAENLGLRNLLQEVHGLSGSELVEKLQSQRQEVEQLMTKNKELKAQLTGMEFLVTELEGLKKEKQRLFNRVVRLEVVEREKSKRVITEAISQSQLQITDVKNN